MVSHSLPPRVPAVAAGTLRLRCILCLHPASRAHDASLSRSLFPVFLSCSEHPGGADAKRLPGDLPLVAGRTNGFPQSRCPLFGSGFRASTLCARPAPRVWRRVKPGHSTRAPGFFNPTSRAFRPIGCLLTRFLQPGFPNLLLGSACGLSRWWSIAGSVTAPGYIAAAFA